MINPTRLCYDLFDDKNLSDSNLNDFSSDFLVRLANNNPGAIYSTLISNTTAKYTAYYGRMASEVQRLQIKEALTVTKKEARDAAVAKVGSLQGLVKYKYGEGSAAYQEFYPQGMEKFYKAKDGDLAIYLDGFVASAVTYLTADYPAEVTAITALTTAYKDALQAQNNAFSLVDNVITGKREDRKALTEQLTLNFLTIAGNNIDNPEKFEDYFDPAYLPITEAPRTYNGIINANTTITAIPAGRITRSSNLTFENKGNTPLTFSISGTAGTIDPIAQLTLAPGQRIHFSENLPVFDRYFLNIQNNSPENGLWHAEVD
jgi:hypothetical protein